MELLGKLSLWIHIIVGTLTLISGPIALFYSKNSKLHRIAGKVFTYCMAVVLITSVIGFMKQPESVFHQFLLGLSVMVGHNVLQGVRAIQFMKKVAQPGRFDHGLSWVTMFCGAVMINAAVWYYFQGASIALPILFGAFGCLTLANAWRFRRFIQQPSVDPRWWFRLHINAMMGAFIASTTAFAVNAIHGLPWYIIWFAPALILQPLEIYFLAKRKLRKKDLGNPFKETAIA